MRFFVVFFLSLFFGFSISQAETLPDSHEQDDSSKLAKIIVTGDDNPHQHNFHDAGDQDWVLFHGIANEEYGAKTLSLEDNCDTVIELYDTDGTTRLRYVDEEGTGQDEILDDWKCPRDGIYYVRVTHTDIGAFGENTGYDLYLFDPDGPTFSGNIRGYVKDSVSGTPIMMALIQTSGGGSGFSLPNGRYNIMDHDIGVYTLTATHTCYMPFSTQAEVRDLETTDLDIIMEPYALSCDMNGDKSIDLKDGVMAVRLMTGIKTSYEKTSRKHPVSCFDINGDNKIGLEEVIYTLKAAAGLYTVP